MFIHLLGLSDCVNFSIMIIFIKTTIFDCITIVIKSENGSINTCTIKNKFIEHFTDPLVVNYITHLYTLGYDSLGAIRLALKQPA